MKRFSATLFALCVASAGLLLAQTKPMADDAALQADRALAAAYAKGDNTTVEKMLDSDFTWIDTDGIMMERPDVLRARLKPLVPMTAETKITEHKYANGKVVWIQVNLGNKYAAHFWVQRPTGWRLLHVNEIATRKPDGVPDYRAPYDIPCDNPCKMVPYKPISPSEQAALAAWQDQEGANGPGHHDMHIGDNVVMISSAMQNPQPLATAPGPTPVQPQRPGTFTTGATPVLWARTWDFGDAVVAIVLQPAYGGKAYWASRIFANHNGFWKMEESYKTTIQASPRMTAMPPTSAAGSN